MIWVPPRTEFERGAEKGNGIVDISLCAISEAMENGMGKVGERCISVGMPNGTLVEYRLKALECPIEIVGEVTLPVESICLVCCISDEINFTRLKQGKPIISYDSQPLGQKCTLVKP